MQTTPATPDIGTTVSEGYSRGLERIGAVIRFSLVPILTLGAVYAVAGFIQTRVATVTVEDAFEAFTNGYSFDNTGSRAIYYVLDAAASIVATAIGVGMFVVIAGAMHRERHGAALDLPEPGASLGATWAGFQLLLPKYWLIVLLPVAGTLVQIVSFGLAGLVQLVAGIVAAWLAVRWVYAPVLAGSGEASGDDAFARSEAAVTGAWWRTFGIYIVVSIAIFLPAGIAGGIIGAILGGIIGWIGLAATVVVVYFAASAIASAALESAWHQVESGAGPVDQAPEPPAADVEPEAGPFV